MTAEFRGRDAASADPYRRPSPGPNDAPRELGPRYATLKVRARCPGCARPVPVNGPVAEVACSSCATAVSVDLGALARLADRYEEHHAQLHDAPETFRLQDGGLVCELAGRDATVHQGLRPAEVPGWLSAHCPTVTRLWLPASHAPDDDEPIAFACPRCRHGLMLDAHTERVTRCGGCGHRVFLPESAWQALHGPVRIETWVLEFRGENRFDRQRRLEALAEARRRRREVALEQAKARAEARARAEQAAAMKADLARLGRHGRVWTALHAAVVLAAIAAPWVLVARPFSGGELAGFIVGSVAVVDLAGALGLAAGARIIRRATGRRDLMFPVWFNYVFTVTMPVIGHLLGFEAIHELKWGEYASEFGRHANLAALNWAIITFGGLAFIASMLVAFLA